MSAAVAGAMASVCATSAVLAACDVGYFGVRRVLCLCCVRTPYALPIMAPVMSARCLRGVNSAYVLGVRCCALVAMRDACAVSGCVWRVVVCCL